MNKLALLTTVIAAATAVFLYTYGSGQDDTPVTALVVVGDMANLAGGDQAMIDRIGDSLGYITEVQDDDQISETLADGYDLVVVSKSVESEKISDRFKNFEGGFWTFEDNLQPIAVGGVPMMALIDETDPSATAWHASTQTWYLATNAGEDLRPGLRGAVEVYRSAGESTYAPAGSLAADAITVVELSDPADGRTPYYAYEAGATLADGSTAAGRRVFFGLYHTESGTTFDKLSAQGLALFDASINWAASRTG